VATVEFKNLVKSFGQTQVLHGIDLQVEDGEFIVFVGPSGCGKSTTLRLLAGLDEVTSGEILIGDVVVNNLEPKERNIAMVFQNYAIYPHMTVRKNIGFGLRTSKLPKADKEKRVEEIAEMLGMTELLDRRPGQLSGGQRQRVAIGRAMVREPVVFLFDEPLSNLDAQLRTQMRLEIKKLHQDMGTTIIFVTHDQVEAMTLADRIVIMKDGHIQQVGTPSDVYQNPANLFVAQFIGAPSMNTLPGSFADGVVTLDVGPVIPTNLKLETDKVTVGIRPSALIPAVGDEPSILEGTVKFVEPLGAEALVYVDLGNADVIATVPGRMPPEVGQIIRLATPAEEISFFDTNTGEALV
jgi:multiple sugar transport system ATP-binding protein